MYTFSAMQVAGKWSLRRTRERVGRGHILSGPLHLSGSGSTAEAFGGNRTGSRVWQSRRQRRRKSERRERQCWCHRGMVGRCHLDCILVVYLPGTCVQSRANQVACPRPRSPTRTSPASSTRTRSSRSSAPPARPLPSVRYIPLFSLFSPFSQLDAVPTTDTRSLSRQSYCSLTPASFFK